jgi:hypothetical protein
VNVHVGLAIVHATEVGVILCWLIAVVIYENDMSLTRYAMLVVLAAFILYFVIRFIHWAWLTPLPFAGYSQ